MTRPAPTAAVRLGTQRIALLLALMLWFASTAARAQPTPDPELPGPSGTAEQDPGPNVYMPFAMLVPGAVSLVTGGVLFGSSADPVDPTRDRIFIAMMGTGAALVVGSGVFFAVRLAQRARWRRGRARAKCRDTVIDCDKLYLGRRPTLYQPFFVFVPGAVLSVAGGVLLHASRVEYEREQQGPDPGEDQTPSMHRNMAAVLLGVGVSALFASAVHLAVRLAKRARWERERAAQGALSRLQVAPSLASDAFGRRTIGALLSTTF